MSWREFFWSWAGRLNRGQFFIGVMIVGFVITLLTLPLTPLFVIEAPGGGRPILDTTRFLLIAQLPATVLQASMAVRRAHDIGFSSYFLLPIPVAVSVCLAATSLWPSLRETWIETLIFSPASLGVVLLLVWPGQKGDNRFGPPPSIA